MINTQGFFEYIFQNAKENSVILMSQKGVILEVNRSFLSAFGYKQSQLVGKNFSILFTEKDQLAKKPGLEIRSTLSKGSKSDNNYLVHKNGTPIWVMGESISVRNRDGEKFIVKIIQNINSQKDLERFLVESNDYLNIIFDSVKDAAFVILNSEMRIIRSNKIFLKTFNLNQAPAELMKLWNLETGFWRNVEIRQRLTDIIVLKKHMKNMEFIYTTSAGKEKKLEITSRFLENEGMERNILLVIMLK